MKKEIFTAIVKNSAFLLIFTFAIIQFFLILRHKSPYLSDSYFYKHIVYNLKGFSSTEVRALILSEVDLEKEDAIGKNIFLNEETYNKALGFFIKRPFYPYSAYILSFFMSLPAAFLIPIFIAYSGSIVLVFKMLRKRLSYLYSVLSIGLFVSFYPYLDWSTYFLTDTISFFFWLLQIYIGLAFIKKGETKNTILFILIQINSLLVREQAILIAPLFGILTILTYLFKFPKLFILRSFKLFALASSISLLYVLVSFFLGQKNIIDTILYTQNQYGLTGQNFSTWETVNYLAKAVVRAHNGFIKDLAQHHWWLMFSLLALLGIVYNGFKKNKRIIDLLVFSSSIASYLAIYLYPVLSYRYFFPVLFGAVYFAVLFIAEFFKKREELLVIKPRS